MSELATSSASCTDAQQYSESIPGAPLDAILCKNELYQGPSRLRDDLPQNEAIKKLIHGWSSTPQSVLQSLVDTILSTLQCDSAGISLINDDRSRFYWPAVAGVWAPHVGGGTPLGFGPCGDVLSAKRALHMKQIHLRYTYFTPVARVKEVLLVPFSVDGKITGTIWAVIHEPPDNQRSRNRSPLKYDREDLRMLEALAELATAAYKVWNKAHIHPTPASEQVASRKQVGWVELPLRNPPPARGNLNGGFRYRSTHPTCFVTGHECHPQSTRAVKMAGNDCWRPTSQKTDSYQIL